MKLRASKNSHSVLNCRYSEYIPKKYQNMELIADKSDAGYQGNVEILLKDTSDSQYYYLSYEYGSCSGCDPWEIVYGFACYEDAVDSGKGEYYIEAITKEIESLILQIPEDRLQFFIDKFNNEEIDV